MSSHPDSSAFYIMDIKNHYENCKCTLKKSCVIFLNDDRMFNGNSWSIKSCQFKFDNFDGFYFILDITLNIFQNGKEVLL